MEVDLHPATFQQDSLVVSVLLYIPLFSCVGTCFFLLLGLTLGRVVLIEVTKKVIVINNSIPQVGSNEPINLQIGAVKSIYVYSFLAIL